MYKMKKLLLMLLLSFGFAVAFSSLMAQEAAAPAAPAVAAPAAGGAGTLEAAPGESASVTKTHANENMNFLTVITRAGWFGEMIWVMLFACLMLCVGLIVDASLTIRDKIMLPVGLVAQVREAIDQGDLLKAMQYCEQTPGALSNILLSGFRNAQEGFEVIQDSVSIAADIETEKMMSKVTYLSVISNTTPMLGLIGTVQGMIFAFFTLGTTEAGAAQQSMLAVNISHGLWATAIGLGTAVPSTMAYYFFKNKANKMILGMEVLTLDVIKTLRNIEVVDEGS
jgi:biopolymer transport protein ExbB